MKLNQAGISHLLVPGFVLLAVVIGATFMTVSKHADTSGLDMATTAAAKAASSSRGTVQVSAVTYKCRWIAGDAGRCRYVKSKASLWVYAAGDEAVMNQKLSCNGKKVASNGSGINFGTARTLRCSPGTYKFKLDDAKAYTRSMDAKYSVTVNVQKGKVSKVRLGSTY